MKKLSIEEAAKAYNKAIERAEGLIDFCSDSELKTLEYVFPELKEFEKIRKWIIDDIKYNMNNEPLNNSEYKKKAEKAIAWLKSLRGRVGCEANCTTMWKPSDEQMKAFHAMNLTGNISYAGQGQTLIELYNDLKKLREE